MTSAVSTGSLASLECVGVCERCRESVCVCVCVKESECVCVGVRDRAREGERENVCVVCLFECV